MNSTETNILEIIVDAAVNLEVERNLLPIGLELDKEDYERFLRACIEKRIVPFDTQNNRSFQGMKIKRVKVSPSKIIGENRWDMYRTTTFNLHTLETITHD